MRQALEIEDGDILDLCGARPALHLRFDRQFGGRFDDQQRIALIGHQAEPQPVAEPGRRDTPAFRRVVNIIRAQLASSVHDLYCIGFAVDRQRMAFFERPAGCAAQLLVEPHRYIERDDHIGKIDTGAAGNLVTAHAVAQPVLPQSDVEQQCIISIGRPPRLGVHRQGLAKP